MAKILAFSGRKGAGKTVAVKYIHSLLFGMIGYKSRVDEEGRLIVLSEDGEGEFKLDDQRPEVVDFLSREIWPFIKKASLADPLKEICINGYGLERELVYGTDEDKNQFSGYLVEDFPINIGGEKKDPLSIRQFLEHFGTSVCRKIHKNFHIGLNQPLWKYPTEFILIDDVRFPNEVEAIHKAGGHVVRLTRNPYFSLSEAEMALNDYNGFDDVINNENMTLEEFFEEVLDVTLKVGLFKTE